MKNIATEELLTRLEKSKEELPKVTGHRKTDIEKHIKRLEKEVQKRLQTNLKTIYDPAKGKNIFINND